MTDPFVPADGRLQAGRPSRTALQVAALRAVHQVLDRPIVFDDPLALRILGTEQAAALQRDAAQYNDPIRRGLRASLVVRSRLAEDELARAVQAGVAQYVVLGAGLDTFAFRNPYGERLTVYEVDHPSTQAWKRGMLQAAGIPVPDSMRFVPTDFATRTLADALRDAGFRADQPAFFSWLGVTMYLEREAVLDTLRFVAALPNRPASSGIVFDYRVPSTLLPAVDAAVSSQMEKHVAEQGEPWKSHFEPAELVRSLQAIGFTRLEDWGAEELNARYFAGRTDGLRKSAGSRLICAYT